MRFQEYHIQQNEALAAKAGLLGQPRQRRPDSWTFPEKLPIVCTGREDSSARIP